MPVYMFSFHAYKSWMPDHPRGYTRRGEGYLPTDEETAREYEELSVADESTFSADVQRGMIERAREACEHLKARLHGAATEQGHTHMILSWNYDRDWKSMRIALKTSLTRWLREKHPGVEFSRGASRKRVKNRDHLEYLMTEYLPDHPGWGWYEDRGWVEPRRKQ